MKTSLNNNNNNNNHHLHIWIIQNEIMNNCINNYIELPNKIMILHVLE